MVKQRAKQRKISKQSAPPEVNLESSMDTTNQASLSSIQMPLSGYDNQAQAHLNDTQQAETGTPHPLLLHILQPRPQNYAMETTLQTQEEPLIMPPIPILHDKDMDKTTLRYFPRNSELQEYFQATCTHNHFESATTLNQAMSCIKAIILRRKLYDPNNPQIMLPDPFLTTVLGHAAIYTPHLLNIIDSKLLRTPDITPYSITPQKRIFFNLPQIIAITPVPRPEITMDLATITSGIPASTPLPTNSLCIFTTRLRTLIAQETNTERIAYAFKTAEDIVMHYIKTKPTIITTDLNIIRLSNDEIMQRALGTSNLHTCQVPLFIKKQIMYVLDREGNIILPKKTSPLTVDSAAGVTGANN